MFNNYDNLNNLNNLNSSNIYDVMLSIALGIIIILIIVNLFEPQKIVIVSESNNVISVI